MAQETLDVTLLLLGKEQMQVVGPIQRDDTTAFFKFSCFLAVRASKTHEERRAKEKSTLEQPDNAARCVDCVVYTLRACHHRG